MYYAKSVVYKFTIPVHIFLKPLQPLDGPYSISNLQNLQFETPEMVYGLTYQFKVMCTCIYIYTYISARALELRFHLCGTTTTLFEI